MKGIDPIADALSATVYTDVINASLYERLVFVIHKGVGTTGVSTVTVLAGSDTANPPTASTAIPFYYKAMTSGDTEGALTAATASGFALTAGSSQVYLIEVDCSELGDTGYSYVCLKAVESVDSEVLAGIMVFGIGGRYQQDIPATALT